MGGARVAIAALAALLAVPMLSGCESKESKTDATGTSSAAASEPPAGSASDRPTELSRGDGERPSGATEVVPDAQIYRQLARRAERIAANTPLAPVPADIDRGSNRGLGYQLMVEFGFAPDQWRYLDALWQRESGWNHLAENPSSGAYGIPQSLPGNKMAVVGADWRSNPETQINWGLAYIGARYGSPEKAWAHSERVGWY